MGRTFFSVVHLKLSVRLADQREKKYDKNAHKINEVDKNSSVWIKWIDSEPWQKY